MDFNREYYLKYFREKNQELDSLYQYFFGYVEGLLEFEHVSAEEGIMRIRELVAAVNEFEQEKKKEREEETKQLGQGK
ncbi:hypothetical protein [Aneurinibacillus aneurinilyticus]|uniref:Uncharacterized protein n=1 Tax=Aneurinibacillus aneurinilyticus ATCC 12856 TaxID=649747 RepID=U1YJ95_ANEAE|nr:hypothetical protein [Aneurinibacillus aneurinilyticus]ERI10836.1 hypothetical protein HMPREF0083_01092 [Aneurinibacillus aneurinilyticus ATCC 12856]MED0705923.1 hypothetical protein [Aneurinibacillus aneurinilyticus]MED0722688.1 hypothetical protein [Aneurinibacillus aneurinilyticus]MED0731392.1 hypothetical protein [Aneurinibacillus aneurinilyticus]MED0740148.1 hypothetical protein [Aneurinibacillus aneurinilyticus]